MVDAALAGAEGEDLDRRSQGGWSARMVVHHLADSEANSYVRLRRLLAEPSGSLLQGYDEAAWARSAELGYQDRDLQPSLAVFRAVRAASSELLERLREADFERAGIHEESGRYTVRDWLRIYAAHAEEHADQIRRARRGEP